MNYISGSRLWPSTWFFNKHSSDHTCFCFSPYVMEDSCYFSCFLEIILVFVDVFLCLSWHSVLTLFFVLSNCSFGSIPVLWILSAFDSLEMISCWFPYFIFVGKSIQSSLSLFVLVICLWLCFRNSILFGINILDNFSLHSTVSLYNLDLSFVCQHFSMPLHVPQSLLCVGYCDCWFYSKIFVIPSVISIGLCWCSPHAYKLHFDDYFIVDFELSPDQAFSLDSMNVCYHLYWLSDGCVVLILISISFWIRGFVFSDSFVPQLPLLIVNLWLWICLTDLFLCLTISCFVLFPQSLIGFFPLSRWCF